MTRHLLLLALSIVLLASCGPRQQQGNTISVSILPERYFVERIAGDRVKVNVMVPPGANPASLDLNTRQLQALHDSRLYFAIGHLPCEINMLYPLLESGKGPRLVKLSDGLQLEEGSCGSHEHTGEQRLPGMDPHVWMSPANTRIMAGKIYETLAECFPGDKDLFMRNYRQFLTEIDSIDREARRIVSSKKHKTFLIYHPALTYFAKEYGMRQISIENEGKEPNPAHVKAIVDTCRAQNIRVVFIQNQFDISNATTIAQEIGGKVIPIDPLAENWEEEMKRLLDIINQEME